MHALADYFNNYAKASLGNDPYAIASFYAQNFIAADPSAALAYSNDESFILWLKNLIEFNKKTGLLKMEVLHLNSSNIGTHYITAKVNWAATFSNQPAKAIPFEITYTLHREPNDYKIILYISHESQEELMKKNKVF